MILMVLLPLIAVALVCVLPRGATVGRSNRNIGRLRYGMRYRLQRVRLSHDWWERFERDFAAYVDPNAARARDRERG